MRVRVHEHHPGDPGQVFDKTVNSLPRVGEYIRREPADSVGGDQSSIELWRVEAIVHEVRSAAVEATLFVSKTDEHAIIDLFEHEPDE